MFSSYVSVIVKVKLLFRYDVYVHCLERPSSKWLYCIRCCVKFYSLIHHHTR